MNIFISYAREDQEKAATLYNDIKNQGYTPWLDQYDLLAGQKWELAIKKALKSSDYCLVLLSKASTQKCGYVQKEQIIAIETLEQFPESDIFLIPVRLDDCELPMRLSHLNAVDIFPDYEKGLDRLFRAFQQNQISSQSPHAFESLLDQHISNRVNIYISYSYIDNDNQWVDTFANDVQSQISKRLGGTDTFSLYWDKHMDSDNPELPQDIIKHIENADILMCIISPGYVNSKKCAREHNTFFRTNSPGMDKQLIVIEREQIEMSLLPKNIQNVRPHRFWIQEKNQSFPKILGEPRPDPVNEPQYFYQMTSLSFEMATNIKKTIQIKSKQSISTPVVESINPLPTVFIAEVTEDLFERRDALYQYLIQQGFQVVPQKPLSLIDVESCKSSMREGLAQSKVFVQLLGTLSGKMNQHHPGICLMQYDVAVQANKHILCWRDPNLKIDACKDAAHKKLLSGENVMAVDFEEFKAYVVKRAQYHPTVKKQAANDMRPGQMIFLNADRVDQHQAEDIEKLLEEKNLTTVLPCWDDKEENIIKDMESFILDSDGVIVVYGYVTTTKIRKQLLMCRNLLFRREKQLPALAIYEGKPGTQPPYNFKMPNLRVINCRDYLDESKFVPFFEDLKQGELS